MEFSKKERKALRIIIEKGLQREFAAGLEKAEAVIKDWREKSPDEHREHYHRLYTTIEDFDKQIARQYDRMTGSWYHLIVLGQLRDGVVSFDELEGLPQEKKDWFKRTLEFLE